MNKLRRKRIKRFCRHRSGYLILKENILKCPICNKVLGYEKDLPKCMNKETHIGCVHSGMIPKSCSYNINNICYVNIITKDGRIIIVTPS